MNKETISDICEDLYKYCLKSIPQFEDDELIWILNGSVLCNILYNAETIDNKHITTNLRSLFKEFVRKPKGDIDIIYKNDRPYKFDLQSREVQKFYGISEEKRTYNFVDSIKDISDDDYKEICKYTTKNGLEFYAKKPQYIFLYKFKEYIELFYKNIINDEFDIIKENRKNIISDIEILYKISCEYYGCENTKDILYNELYKKSVFFNDLYNKNKNNYYEIIDKLILTISNKSLYNKKIS